MVYEIVLPTFTILRWPYPVDHNPPHDAARRLRPNQGLRAIGTCGLEGRRPLGSELPRPGINPLKDMVGTKQTNKGMLLRHKLRKGHYIYIWMYGWMYGCMDVWMDIWMDGCMYVCWYAGMLVCWYVGMLVCWYVLVCSGMFWYVLVCSGYVLVCSGMFWYVLVCSWYVLVCSSMFWYGLVWSGMVWSGLVCLYVCMYVYNWGIIGIYLG